MAFTKVTGPGIHSLAQLQTHNIHSAGIITAAQFVGDGSELTGVSGFATAMSNDQYSILNDVFTTGKTDTVAAGTSVLVESNPTAGYIAFTRAENIVVATGATLTISKVGSGTTLKTDILFNNDGANADKLDGQDGSYYTDALNITGTLPDAIFPATLPALDGSALTALNANNIASGIVTSARLGGGTANATSFLNGDGQFATDGSALTTLNADNIASGIVISARLGASPTATTFLRGDGQFATAGGATEGTWTPVAARGGTDINASYTTQRGTYTKVGKLVYVECYLHIASVTSQAGSGECWIKGLPFAPEYDWSGGGWIHIPTAWSYGTISHWMAFSESGNGVIKMKASIQIDEALLDHDWRAGKVVGQLTYRVA